MTKPYLLEICACNVQSCIIAERAGAGRIELCDNAADGGTTPSYGTVKQVKDKVNIPVYPIIRPRGGDFVYDTDEIAIMRHDIQMCRELGCEGISTGVQQRDGKIDALLMQQIIEWAYPMKVTCHRVFDTTPDAFEAMEALIQCGCERILTSGQKPTALEGAVLIHKLVQQAGSRIIIMPGGGVRPHTLQQLIPATNAREYHSAARVPAIQTVNMELDMGTFFITDEVLAQQMSQHLQSL